MKKLLNSIPELNNWIDYEDISTGLVNKIYKIRFKDGYKILRVLNDRSYDLGINRTNEFYNSTISQKSNITPKLLGFNFDFNYLVTEYLDGKVITNNDLDFITIDSIVQSMKSFHKNNRFVNEFNPFEMINFFEQWLIEHGYKFKKDKIKIRIIKKFLKRDVSQFVPCHNDIRAFGNIIDTQDRIKFVDLEFTGNNDPCYDIGFFWSESGLSMDWLNKIVYLYFEKDVSKNAAKAQLYAVVADYMWHLQGLIGSKLCGNEDKWLMYSNTTYNNYKNKSKTKNLIRLLISLF